MKSCPLPVRVLAVAAAVAAALAPGLVTGAAQEKEPKPVPGNSVRVSIPGCSRGSSFVAGAPAEDQPGGSSVPDGTRLRMNGPRKLMADIKGQEGSRIEITGLIRKGQDIRGGIPLGGGVRVGGGGSGPAAPLGGSIGIGSPGGGQLMIDVEGWRHIPGDCSR